MPTVTRYATQDCYVANSNPTVNYNNTVLYIGQPGGNVDRSFIAFDVPRAGTVISATFYLYQGSTGGSSGEPEDNIRRITSSWAETDPTWNNQPSDSGVTMAKFPYVLAGNWAALSVTSLAQFQAMMYLNYGVRMRGREDATDTIQVFASSENTGYEPYVIVNYMAGGGGITVILERWKQLLKDLREQAQPPIVLRERYRDLVTI